MTTIKIKMEYIRLILNKIYINLNYNKLMYLKSNICKETTLWGGYFGILCDKKKLNAKAFYEKFPIISII